MVAGFVLPKMNNKQAQLQTISNRNHVSIKLIRALREREERDRRGLFYGEGIRFLIEAVKHHANIEMLVVCPPLVVNAGARMLVAKLRRAGTSIIEVTPEVLHSLAQIEDPQGVGAVVKQKWRTLDEVKLDGRLCWVALESVQSPGNLGSMVRTASAVGAAGFIFLGDSVDVYDPASVRAGMGAIFAQRFVRTTPQELAEWKVPRQWRLIGTSPNGDTDYRHADYTSDPVIVMLGSERKGLSPELLDMCDTVVNIPMSGKTDSLNISVAAGVVLYEVYYQRRRTTDRETGHTSAR